jgi:hypothetical protein
MRWVELLLWVNANGGLGAIHELHSQVEAWKAFEKQWNERNDWWWVGAPGVVYALIKRDTAADALSAAASDLAIAESNAARRGYVIPTMEINEGGGVYKKPGELGTGANSPPMVRASGKSPEVVVTPPSTPNEAKRHPVATWINEAAPDLPFAPKQDAGVDRRPGAKDPYLAPKALGVGALAIGTIVAASTAKADSTRVTVALVGVAATAAAGWIAFGPATPTKGRP